MISEQEILTARFLVMDNQAINIKLLTVSPK